MRTSKRVINPVTALGCHLFVFVLNPFSTFFNY